MTWALDVTAGIPRLTQSGTDTGLAGIATAITAQATVARSTAYTTAQMVKPPTPTGFWYRCSTAGTTAASAPTYGTTLAGTTTDGTAVFTAFKAPDVQTLGTTNHYYMPDIRVAINGTLTNTNPQQQNFTCWDLIIFGGNFISGAWASDGVTPLWDGLHFAATRNSTSGADGTSMSLQSGGQFTFIGGEVQTGGGVTFDNATTPRSYLTRWRNTKEYGASSARFRSSTTLAIFQNVETYDFAFDLFKMPTVAPSIKSRGSEYVYQYVGALAGGTDAKFAASNLENPNGTYDFDNYSGGWVELYNCSKGATLSVVSQYPNSTIWVKHCVPLYQDIAITAKDTAGAAVQDVRFTATENPTNSPTVTFTTAGGLKTWDFRTPLSYQTTTNASGIALSSPVLNIWYWQTSFKQSLRFPSSTATYQGRAYNYKTVNVQIPLGASTTVQSAAGMVNLDTQTTISETAAGLITGINLSPTGSTGGTVTISSNHDYQNIWNYYRYWIAQFSNRGSDDVWDCIGGVLNTKNWNIIINSGVTVAGSPNISKLKTLGSLTNNGAITAIYESSAGTSTILELRGVTNQSSCYVGNNSTGATIFFEANSTTATKTLYFPPGSSGLNVLVARELYGYQRVSEVITLSEGFVWYQFVDIEDVGISVPIKATVAAYTALDNPDKVYDYTAYKRLEEAFIKLGQITIRDGSSLLITPYSMKVDHNAGSIYSITGDVITIKSSSYEVGTKYIKTVTAPPDTVTAHTNEVITCPIEDANGDSQLTISGGDGNYELWKITTATPTDNYATGTLLSTVSTGIYRFIGLAGFDIVGRDTNSGIRRRSSMAKGLYEQKFYVGDQIQLAQQPEVLEILTNVQILQVDIDSIKGTGFAQSTDSLEAISDKVSLIPTNPVLTNDLRLNNLANADVATSSRLAASSYTAPDNTSILEIKASTTGMKDALIVANQQIINQGAKKASLLIPHTQNTGV